MAVETNGRKITRDDLEAAFSQVIGEGEAFYKGERMAGERRCGGRDCSR